MQCNIDARGKAVRLVWGLINLVGGLVFLVLFVTGTLTGHWVWALGVFMIAGGALGIFEARKGWCIVRAMGIKTPI